MKNQHTVDAYNVIAPEFASSRDDPFYWKYELELFQELTKRCGRLLEIGCGAGRDARILASVGFDYFGIDPSIAMLRQSRLRISKERAIYACMDFHNLCFRNVMFDCFWASASLLHIKKEDIKDVLQSVRFIVRKGGYGFISIKEMSDSQIEVKQDGECMREFFLYTLGEFARILMSCRYTIVASYTKRTKQTTWLCYFVKIR